MPRKKRRKRKLPRLRREPIVEKKSFNLSAALELVEFTVERGSRTCLTARVQVKKVFSKRIV